MLTRDKILSAGLEIVDREGPQSLTMRRLAQRLEVTATAIYHYFDGREEVLGAIVDHVCAAIVAETPQDGELENSDPAQQFRAGLDALLAGLADRKVYRQLESPRSPAARL
jgi:AcrR family transcriptional regulator